MALQSLDIKQRSATTTPSTQVRQTVEIAKLIDVSACIGCKACQVACSEWNDIRDEVGNCHGVYDNPMDLSAKSWTVMRYTEVEQNNKLEWLIRKDGCMHCADPGCLKACPAPGAIIQYANGIVDFHQENCIGCGYCVTGCPFNVPRISKEDSKAYKCSLCSDRVAVNQAP
ncbi:MAG: 4Fe-4S dicluster domain-containing protein, partial [Dechloromonas sp.]|nr:4Fe-4S dicluster domain-containing protein [Dechloromonas sp.]